MKKKKKNIVLYTVVFKFLERRGEDNNVGIKPPKKKKQRLVWETACAQMASLSVTYVPTEQTTECIYFRKCKEVVNQTPALHRLPHGEGE